jgi:hypothetical protein
MELLPILADLTIRRACGFAALGIGTVMLALSFDLPLALRSGAVLTSIACGVLWLMAWATPRRDIRQTEMWSLLVAERRHLTRGAEAGRLQAMAAQVLRDRLVWHAERVAIAALVMWACTGVAMLARAVLAG